MLPTQQRRENEAELSCSWIVVWQYQRPSRSALKIGEVAKRSGLSVKTIRFYCDKGLIHPTGRSEGSYRLFEIDVFAELTLIRSLKALEIPLRDVLQVLTWRRSDACTCSTLQVTLWAKSGEIEQKIDSLRSLYNELHDLLERWEDCSARKSDRLGQ